VYENQDQAYIPQECNGDAIMAELQEKQTAVNKEFMNKSGALCKQVAE
jgi:hypothetical protein